MTTSTTLAAQFRSCASALIALALAACLLVAAPATAMAQGFDPMAPRSGGFDPMRPRGGSPAPSTDTEAPRMSEFGGLPEGAGAEETFYLCSACHSLAIVTQQSLTDARWDYLWDWMIETQGMAEMDEATKTLVLDYLKRHFSADR